METQEFRDFLIGVFKDLIWREAEKYLANLDEYRRDAEKEDYRTEEESQLIRDEIRKKADEMSTDFVDELNAKGVVTPDDLEEKQETVKDSLRVYQQKFSKWLQEQ